MMAGRAQRDYSDHVRDWLRSITATAPSNSTSMALQSRRHSRRDTVAVLYHDVHDGAVRGAQTLRYEAWLRPLDPKSC
jgi:hypothetical protein